MSTHFRPRPAPTPTSTSPIRPSTAHSTIRAITPSPPNIPSANFSMPRPKSEHALGSRELSNFKRYVLKAEAVGFSNTPEDAGAKLQRGGIASGRTSPIKSGRSSPVKSERSSVIEARSKSPRNREPELQGFAESPCPDDSPIIDAHDEQNQGHGSEADEEKRPDTPTPMTRAQKRQAYIPLGSPTNFARPSNASFQQLTHPGQGSTNTTILPVSHKSINDLNPHPVSNDRISVSDASALSTASKYSIFRTPGRDELERKKALIEVDEGPFARAKSMMDLDEERRRVSSGETAKESGEKVRWCGLPCVVM